MVCVKLVCLAVIASLCEVSVGQCLRRVRPSCTGSPRAAPCLPPPSPYRSINYNLNGAYRYERNLEGIISKLVNALIYTSICKCRTGSSESGGSGAATGGGLSGETKSTGSAGVGSTGCGTGIAGGGNNSGGGSGMSGDALDRLLSSLLSVDLALGGTDVLNVDVLGSNSSGGISGGGSTGSTGSVVSGGSGGTDGAVSKGSDDLLNKIYNSLLKLEVGLGKQAIVGGGGSGSGGREGSGSGSGSGGRGGVGGGGSGGQLDGLLDLLNLELDLGTTDVLDVSVLGDRSSSGNLDRNILSLLLLDASQGTRSGN